MFSLERKKTFLLGVASFYGNSIASLIMGLFSIPIGLNYFGPVRYGFLAVISSIIGYLNFSNLGLQTTVSVLIAKTLKPFEQRAILLRSLLLITISSISVLLLFIVVVNFFPNWIIVFGKIPDDIKYECNRAAVVTIILFLINLPFRIFSDAFTGLQMVYWSRFYNLLERFLDLIILLLVVFVLKGNLVMFSLLRGVGTFFINIICGLHLLIMNPQFNKKSDDLIGEQFSVGRMFKTGMKFLIIGLAAMVVWNTDNLIISHFLGIKAVTPYAITFKVFSIIITFYTAINSTLTPMYGRASAMEDWEWINKVYNILAYLLPMIGGLVWIGGIGFAKEFICLWAGSQAYGGFLTVFSLGGYAFILAFINVNSHLITGINPTKIATVFAWIEAVVNLCISILLVRSFGIGGAALGTFLAAVFAVSWIQPIYVYRLAGKKVKLNVVPILRHTFFILIPCLILTILVYFYCNNLIYKVCINLIILSVYCVLTWHSISKKLSNEILKIFSQLNLKKFLK